MIVLWDTGLGCFYCLMPQLRGGKYYFKIYEGEWSKNGFGTSTDLKLKKLLAMLEQATEEI